MNLRERPLLGVLRENSSGIDSLWNDGVIAAYKRKRAVFWNISEAVESPLGYVAFSTFSPALDLRRID